MKEFKPLAQKITNSEPLSGVQRLKSLLAPFATLYDLVAAARNDAVHQGAYGRHLTKNAIRLAIVLEEALKSYMDLVVMDFMVPNPTYAEYWQLVSLVRQQCLRTHTRIFPSLIKMETGTSCLSRRSGRVVLEPKEWGNARMPRVNR